MDTRYKKYAKVVLDASIGKMLDYGIPDSMLEHAKRGVRVEAPVKGMPRPGIIYAVQDVSDYPKVQPLTRLVSETELIPDDLFELALWMARYYCAPLRRVFTAILPATVRKDTQHKQQLFVMRSHSKEQTRQYCEEIRNKHPAQAAVLDEMLQVKKGILLTELLEKTQGTRSPVDSLVKKGWLQVDIVRVDRSPLINEEYFPTKPKILTGEQAGAMQAIAASLEERRFEAHLLFGVTGSGKTEVYLQAIDKALQQNLGTLVLVPEIALTEQTIRRFRSRFEGHIAVLHHRLSQGERFDEWHKVRRGEAKIVIGARSAVFSPMPNLGLIIVDEEHEPSYKQNEEAPCYNARDVAIMRGKMTNSTVILGSATPSLESYHNALTGKYRLSKLQTRAENSILPQFHIVDMNVEYTKAQGFTNFSALLLDGIKSRMEKGELTILFLNRRGYHTTLLCQECKAAVKCQHCDVSMTFHLGDNHLACHLCGYMQSPPPKECPACKSGSTMKFKGAGTELIEKSLHAILPQVRTIRLDADTTRHKGSHQKLLREFGAGKADVLIGTQMIAKGLHFPEVTLVGVLNSDAGLNIPDFRASETSFQLITQVAGRAGRGVMPGEVIVQTCLPQNTTIQLAAEQNYEKFYKEEIAIRELFHYPPFSNMAKVAFYGSDPNAVFAMAEELRRQLIGKLPSQYELHPVIPAGHAKVKDQYRFQFLVRGKGIYKLSEAIEQAMQTMPWSKDIRCLVDINPSSTFF